MIITEEISPLILSRYVQNAYANRFMLLLPINFSMYNTESVMLHTIIYMYVFHRDSTSELFQWLPRKHITLERSLKLFAEEFYN